MKRFLATFPSNISGVLMCKFRVCHKNRWMKTYDIVPRKFSIKHLDSYEETLCVCVSVCGGGALLDKVLSMLLSDMD